MIDYGLTWLFISGNLGIKLVNIVIILFFLALHDLTNICLEANALIARLTAHFHDA